MQSHLCPNCGCYLQSFAPVRFGNIACLEPGSVLYEERSINLPKCQYLVVEALVKARGRGLTRSALANCVGTDINNETISKYIERLRVRFRTLDPHFDQIRVLQGFGAYSWVFKDARSKATTERMLRAVGIGGLRQG
ncbi:MAG: hypothetical protein V4684_20840 [Pseudomonadota bacterium]